MTDTINHLSTLLYLSALTDTVRMANEPMSHIAFRKYIIKMLFPHFFPFCPNTQPRYITIYFVSFKATTNTYFHYWLFGQLFSQLVD